MKRLAFAFVITSLVAACAGSKRSVSAIAPVDPRWIIIDSLEQLGQYATALERTDTMLAQAMRTGDWRTEFKAWMRHAEYRSYTAAEETDVLKEMGVRANEAPVPLAQLLHSVRAEGWWNLYAEDRWSILERTELAEGGGDDPQTWTQRRFMAEVIAAYTASVRPTDTLKTIAVGELGDLLTGDTAARYLRPTLFDLLARRALIVFENSETRLAEPAWRFTLSDPRYFTLFEPFAMRPFRHRDSTAWEFQAIRLYQELEKQHLVDDKIDAYVDVAIDRLNYVFRQSDLPNKDSLHLDALELLRTRLPEDACWSEVTLAIAQWHVRAGAKYDRLAGDAWKWERKRAVELCDSAIARWPSSFGARNARVTKLAVERVTLDAHCERAVPPDSEFLIKLQTTNAKEVWYRIVGVPDEDRNNQTTWINRLLTQRVVREGSFNLPDDGDHNEHVVEVPVQGLPFGAYAILVCNAADLNGADNALASCNVQVTNFAMVGREQGSALELLVLDRTTGQPLSDVKATLHTRGWTSGEQSERSTELITDENGKARTTTLRENGRATWTLELGSDRYESGERYVYQQGNSTQDTLRTFLFTDRAIYRPGQEIHVKGIVTVARGKDNAVKAGHSARLYFHDTNGEVIDSLIVVTDAFGSFHGTFTAPVGRLTGQMQLREAHGEKGIQVEEYKRPTFEATFAPIITTPKLGEKATVAGIAKTYAGAPLDGAKVKYTVQRSARMPWWCGPMYRGLPWWTQTEIASGEALCDADGRFTISFPAEASRSFPLDADPSFVFHVVAWVTDINGETQTTSTSFVVGYRSIDLVIGVGDAVDRNNTDSLLVRVNNLNGERIDQPFDVKVTQLVRPDGPVKRERLGQRPDRFVLTREEHTARFPQDVYDNENDPATWTRGAVSLDLKALSPKGSQVAFTGSSALDVGTYLIEMEAMDPRGQLVKASRVFTLFDAEVLHTGFENEAFHVEVVKSSCEPGEKAVLLLSTALPECRVLMEVERDGRIAVDRPFVLRAGQQRVELPVLESDRGGFAVHFVCVERGREHLSTQWIAVPWSNKQLKVEWMSFRDKLLPGANEEWRLKITGPKKEKVAAQVLAAMYDASLDVFSTPSWWMEVWGSNNAQRAWGNSEPFGLGGGQVLQHPGLAIQDTARNYPRLADELVERRSRRRFRTVASPAFGSYDLAGAEMANGDGEDQDRTINGLSGGAMDSGEMLEEEDGRTTDDGLGGQGPSGGGSALRTDFRETAFFFPDQLTDRDGNVVLRFTMPDALTRWNFMGLAHTKELQTAQFGRSVITQKPLMVMPNLPRFLRQGDRIVLTAKINVIDGGALNGTASLELFDPRTNKPVTGAFGMSKTSRAFTAAIGQSANVSWELMVPDDIDAVAVRITANGGTMSDGEERVLPILTDKVLMTESVPLAITKAGTRSFSLPNLLSSGASTTLQHRSLTLEFTPNPAWYAVQALPYLMEFPHECAEQTFSRYYANHLAAHIVIGRPNIKKVFEAWNKGTPGNEGAFLSALEKNPELKGVLLEETPWVINAKDESERKRRIALFFDLNRMANEDAAALKKLQDMQLPSGAWPWWSGMQPSRYITQHIVAGFGHLQQLDALDTEPDTGPRRMVAAAVKWLDTHVEEDFQRMKREWKGDTLPLPSSEDIHYIYARSCFPQYPLERKQNSAVAFILERARRDWLRYGMQEQAMIAIALHRLVDEEMPKLITTSLSQRATMSEELGMYWKDFQAGYSWNSFPTETHALMIEAFELVARDREKVNALRQYLLKLKQTTDWKTTKATADACYALLLTGEDLLEPKSDPVITVGGEKVKATQSEAGTGYFQMSWPGSEVKAAMGKVTVSTTSDGVQWGALHWQYLEQMDKVKPHESPFSLRRQVMLNEQTDIGARLIALTEARPLKPGDKLTVRVELRTDRYLDHVHLKDLRAAGLEPVQTNSGYEWKSGLGYYRSIRDAAMHFFFDRIAPGTYVFEYDLKVTHAGTFSNGITNVQCMYAPEFSSHSEGLRIEVGAPE